MFTQPVRNYNRSEQFLYGRSPALGLFLENAISLRVKHLHELHLIAHYLVSPFVDVHSARRDPLKAMRMQLNSGKQLDRTDSHLSKLWQHFSRFSLVGRNSHSDRDHCTLFLRMR